MCVCPPLVLLSPQPVVGRVVIASGSFGGALILFTSLGLWAAYTHNRPGLAVYALLTLGLFAACVYGADYCVKKEASATATANAMNATQLGALAYPLTAAELASQLRTFYT